MVAVVMVIDQEARWTPPSALVIKSRLDLCPFRRPPRHRSAPGWFLPLAPRLALAALFQRPGALCDALVAPIIAKAGHYLARRIVIGLLLLRFRRCRCRCGSYSSRALEFRIQSTLIAARRRGPERKCRHDRAPISPLERDVVEPVCLPHARRTILHHHHHHPLFPRDTHPPLALRFFFFTFSRPPFLHTRGMTTSLQRCLI